MIINAIVGIAFLTLPVVVPQVLGFLASFLCRNAPLGFRLVVSIALPPLVYFAVVNPYFTSLVATVVANGGRPCGLFGLVVALICLGGTVGHLTLAFLLHVGAVLEQRAFARWGVQ